jgi:hypothetical protein
MAATPQDVQAKLDVATAALAKTTLTYPAMVKKYGSDPTKWPPTSYWFQALTAVAAARAEVGQLVVPHAPVAQFTDRQV